MNEQIEQAFANFTVDGVAIPVAFLRYEGPATSYVTYAMMDADADFSADDQLQNYVDYYDFDIYTKGNYMNIIAAIQRTLEGLGWRWQPDKSSGDMFEDDTGYYHKTLNFSIERKYENG